MSLEISIRYYTCTESVVWQQMLEYMRWDDARSYCMFTELLIALKYLRFIQIPFYQTKYQTNELNLLDFLWMIIVNGTQLSSKVNLVNSVS